MPANREPLAVSVGPTLLSIPNEQADSMESKVVSGLRVIEIQKDSPACDELVLFLDILVSVNSVSLTEPPDTYNSDNDEKNAFPIDRNNAITAVFAEQLRKSENKSIPLEVFNLKTRETRTIHVTPNQNWDGKGLLGVTVCNVEFNIDEFESSVLRVLEVRNNSPAFKAGLQDDNDFIIGCRYWQLKNMQQFQEVLQECLLISVEVFVYNCETDTVRRVRIRPKKDWMEVLITDEVSPPQAVQGKGILGCQLAQGNLHRIPQVCRKSVGLTDERSLVVLEKQEPVMRSKSNKNGAPPTQSFENP